MMKETCEFWDSVNNEPASVAAAVRHVPLEFLLRLRAPRPELKETIKGAASVRLNSLRRFARRNWNEAGERASHNADLLAEWMEKALA